MALNEIVRTKDVLIDDVNVNFESLFLSTPVLTGLKDYEFTKPSPIQLKAIPLGKCGFDLIVKAKSGTGKTAVFSIIALEMIDCSNSDLQVLILAPTREIAVQTCDVIKTIGKCITGLKVEHFIGGLPVAEDKIKSKGCHIAVGSPGRMLHMIKSGTLQMGTIKLFVLDEADNLMQQSYQGDINQIYHYLPKNKQMLAVSATYPDELDVFLAKYMHLPTHVSPTMDTPLLLGLKHFISITNFNANIIHSTRIKNNELIRLLSQVSFTQCLIFCNYQTRAEEVSNFLNANKKKSNFISAAQTQQQRLDALKQLKDFQCRILLSTDLTSRGIDAVNVDLVINYDVPHDESTYLHRMGRAGRYGTKGVCVTMASKGGEVAKFRAIIGSIGGVEMSVPVLPVGEGSLPANIWEANTEGFETVKGTLNENQRFGKIVESVREICTANNPEQLIIEEEKIVDVVEVVNKMAPVKNTSCEDNEAFELLMKLASGENIAINEEKNSSSFTFTKNVSLLAVSSLLDDDKMDESNDQTVAETIENFIGNLKANEGANKVLAETQDIVDIEDVFIHAYDYAISKKNPNWSELYGFNDEDEECVADEPVNLLQDFLEYADEEEAEDFYGDCDYEEEDCMDADEYDEDAELAAGPSLQWIPVNPSNEIALETKKNVQIMKHESTVAEMDCSQSHFSHLYETAVNDFQQGFNTLEDVPSFDGMWQNFQTQINNIRDYVQQNIYLQEMNLYKSKSMNKFG